MVSTANKVKLNFRFHDPNPPAEAAEYILSICIQASRGKLERAIAEAAANNQAEREPEKSLS